MLTALAPTSAAAAWDGPRLRDPDRVTRRWFAGAVATRWAVSVSGAAALALPACGFAALPAAHSAQHHQHGEPVRVTGRVRLLSDGKFEDPRPTHGGWRFFDGGTTAVLETTDDHTLVLTSERIGNTSIAQMYALGIRPEDKRIVVAKGVQSPRPAYAPIAAELIVVNTPGITASDLRTFSYHHRRRPLYPFEPTATY